MDIFLGSLCDWTILGGSFLYILGFSIKFKVQNRNILGVFLPSFLSS